MTIQVLKLLQDGVPILFGNWS